MTKNYEDFLLRLGFQVDDRIYPLLARGRGKQLLCCFPRHVGRTEYMEILTQFPLIPSDHIEG